MAPPRKRLYTDVEIINAFMQEGSDDEEDVVRCFDEDERETIDLDEEEDEPEFLDIMLDGEIDPSVDLDLDLDSGDDGSDSEGSTTRSRSSSVPSSATQSNNGTAAIESDAESNGDEEEDYMNDWCKSLANFPLVPPFTGISGFQVEIEPEPTPLTFHSLFVTQDIVKLFKRETNLYARQIIDEKLRGGNVSPRSIYRKWHTVTEAEIYSFLAILIHMGLVKKNLITDYWSTDITITSPFAAICMGRERFRTILSFFHINNNATFIPRGQPNHDPLHKIRPLYDHLRQAFSSVYRPTQNICIDEALCPWRGRAHMRVYMRDKPVKWGIKLYQLCESGSGYIWSFEVMANEPNLSNTPYDVSHRLVGPLKNVGHTLFVDNYYCNPALCDSLVAENTMVVGTVRANRIGMPKDLVGQPMNRGDVDYRRRNQLLALRWKDKRDVHILTTKHLPTTQEHTTRTETKEKPTAVIDYSKNMSGVDLNDQLVAYMPFHRKTVKWWKKLAFHLLTVCFIQAHILHNKHRKQRRQRVWKLEKFVHALCKSLAQRGKQLQIDQQAAAAPAPDIERLSGRHFPIPYDDSGAKKRGTCVVCSARLARTGAGRADRKNHAQKTLYKCGTCNKSLCVYPCFENYHTKEDYSQ